MLDETLVVVMSEMGPRRRSTATAAATLDLLLRHVVRPGGHPGGSVCGASDAHAAYVKDRPVSTGDVCATIYQCLGTIRT